MGWLLPEGRVTESHLDRIKILIMLSGTNMDRILRGSKLIRISAVDGDVGAGIVQDSFEPERE